MTRMTTEELEKLRGEMTPGPWAKDKRPTFGDFYIRDDPPNWKGNGRLWIADVNGGRGFGNANARAIALTPDLIAEVLELRAANARLRDALAVIEQYRPRVDISDTEFLREFIRPTARAALKETTK